MPRITATEIDLEDDGSSSVRWTAAEVARLVGGQLHGEAELPVTGVASIEEATDGDLIFAETVRLAEAAARSRASAILISADTVASVGPHGQALIVVENPRAAFVTFLEELGGTEDLPAGIHHTAVIERDVRLGASVRVDAVVTIGAGSEVGSSVRLHEGVRIGERCRIGDGTTIHPNAVLYPGVRVGRRCILHAGCVIGADGFGYVPVGASLRKVPHLGSVDIGDDVEVGANTCIDRARTGATVIGAGTKIDNLVHVAHNVHVGRSTVIVAQVGVAGSVEIGSGVMLGGQVGIKDHVSIGDGARVGAQAGVIGDVAAGEVVSGYPARPHRRQMRQYAALAALPEYLKRVRELEARILALEHDREGAAKSG